MAKSDFNNFRKKKITDIFFGFGPSSDRLLIKENLSNALIYSLFSGGLISFLSLLSLYAISLKQILIYIFFKQKKEDQLFGYTCSFYILFLFLRSVVENSFVVFGTDNIFFISSLLLLVSLNKKN